MTSFMNAAGLHGTGIIHFLLSISVLGFLGLSVLCPLLAMAAAVLQRRVAADPAPGRAVAAPPRSIEIVVPAHNEAAVIGATIASLRRAMARLHSRSIDGPPPVVSIHVGADSCTDDTAAIAASFPGVSVYEFLSNRSKWLTLKTMCEDASAEWVVLVDAGTLWPEDFLCDLVDRIARTPDLLGLCPRYRPLNAGILNRAVWAVETVLKKLECLSGGPVSVHGATVCYRTAALKRALAHLGE